MAKGVSSSDESIARAGFAVFSSETIVYRLTIFEIAGLMILVEVEAMRVYLDFILIGEWSTPMTRGEKMRSMILVSTIATLLWGAPAFAGSNPDFDLDGVGDAIDNCSEAANPNQDDTDADDCGNLCDADYNQDGNVGFGDFGEFTGVGFGTTNALYNHTEPVTDTVGFGDFGFYTQAFGRPPGPSGTTAGTIACP